MAFGIGTNTAATETGRIYGKQEDVACDCWFTRTGRTIPRFLKYEDKDGIIQEIQNIHVHSRGKKNYCGIPTMEYECSAKTDGCEYRFRLLYQMQEGKWKIIWQT
ncbi:MAG: hypothetical protein H2212_03400 [Ruminococcus sp.]|nr:hypothetical protein [Ruminococcus sp.]